MVTNSKVLKSFQLFLMATLLRNILVGAGSILNLYPTLSRRRYIFYNPAPTDVDAIQEDWVEVGHDLSTAMTNEKEKTSSQKTAC